MLQLADGTPFVSTLSLLQDPQGIDTLYVVVKGTFTLGPELALASEQQPLQLADVPWGEPGASSLRYAGEIHPAKPATDVALVGSAHAPGGRPVTELDTLLVVGPLRKQLHVVGDRLWTGRALGPALEAAQPFTTMPLTWERAYGGVHVLDADKGKVKAVEENPVGAGFRARRRRAELKGLSAPNLLDPKDEERPAGTGFVAPNWQPRRGYAGTYDDAWQRERAPILPADFDSRFFNAAAPGLVADGYLQGGERVKLANLTPDGRLSCELPRCRFDLTVRLAGRSEAPALNLETVLLEPDEQRLSLLWRAAVPCDKQTLQVEQVRLELAELVLNGKAVS